MGIKRHNTFRRRFASPPPQTAATVAPPLRLKTPQNAAVQRRGPVSPAGRPSRQGARPQTIVSPDVDP